METQSQHSTDESVMHTRLFCLDRGFNDQLKRSSLFLRPRFPWVSSVLDNTSFSGNCGLLRVNAVIDEESPAVVLDDFEGVSLASRFEKQAPTTAEAITILRQIAAAVDSLHACNRVHGALSTSAILVDEELSLRIVDWIVDWSRVPLSFLTEAAEFLSPERLSDAPVGPHADQFSFGVIAHELLIGRSPFPGESFAERLFRTRYGLLDDGIFGETGLATHSVFERVFSVNPDRRFESCSAFLDAIEKSSYQRNFAETRLFEGEYLPNTSQAEIEAAPQEESPSPEVNQVSLTRWWITAGLFALLAFTLGVASWQFQGQIDRERDLAEQLKMSASDNASLENGTFQVCNSTSESLKIRELAVAYWDSNHKLRVFNSVGYTQDGWLVAPASSQFFSWPKGQKTVWDGSVLLYSLKVQEDQKEFIVSGRWDSGNQACLDPIL
jgi:serine/threonine protein kinase